MILKALYILLIVRIFLTTHFMKSWNAVAIQSLNAYNLTNIRQINIKISVSCPCTYRELGAWVGLKLKNELGSKFKKVGFRKKVGLIFFELFFTIFIFWRLRYFFSKLLFLSHQPVPIPWRSSNLLKHLKINHRSRSVNVGHNILFVCWFVGRRLRDDYLGDSLYKLFFYFLTIFKSF